MHAGELTGEQTDQAGSRRVIEVAAHGISYHDAKVVKRLA
jgi:hypothetical protein